MTWAGTRTTTEEAEVEAKEAHEIDERTGWKGSVMSCNGKRILIGRLKNEIAHTACPLSSLLPSPFSLLPPHLPPLSPGSRGDGEGT